MKKRLRAFTLIEMLIVLAIISILILLFVPNLVREKSKVQDTGTAAVVKVVESQAELYRLDHDGEVHLSDLKNAGLISQKQLENYQKYYEKNKDAEGRLPD